MYSLSLFDNKSYSYSLEKRRYKRVSCNQLILHPTINGQATDVGTSSDHFIKLVSLSEGGIGLICNINLKIDDFLYFALYVEDNPSFEVLCIVKWVGFSDFNIIAGCEFINLKYNQINIIRDYVNKKLKKV